MADRSQDEMEEMRLQVRLAEGALYAAAQRYAAAFMTDDLDVRRERANDLIDAGHAYEKAWGMPEF